MTRSVAKNRSATKPTNTGDTRDAIDTVPNTIAASVAVKCSVRVRYVLIVTYQEPQIRYCRNIMPASRDFSQGDVACDFGAPNESPRPVVGAATTGAPRPGWEA